VKKANCISTKNVEGNIAKGEMSQFMSIFKVKRDLESYLREYTKDSFFHKIINIGLRILWNPYELIYLRLPFYHIFWSIRFLYHRHKRAIFKKAKNKKKILKLYRGCSLMEKEIEELMSNVNGYIEAEGFLSTSLSFDRASAFAVNVMIEISVPVANLKSMIDNGFARIAEFSELPN
jgi:hypothetical protein